MTEEEQFFAWLDGELDEREAAEVEARVAASPELTAKADAHRAMAQGLRRGFSPALEGIKPPQFESAQVVEFGARTGDSHSRRRSFGLPQWVAMAATLVLGLVVGNFVGGDRGGSPVAIDDGRMVAAAALDRSLDTALASAPVEGSTRIGLTFRNAQGQLCRSFQEGAASGLACRDGEQWRIAGLFQGAEGQSSDYRMAAGQDPRLAELIAQTIAGEPFDKAQEQAARESGWR